ncbi:uncharacterized protein [Choristoneura fumiferana]|uniref:uncharacterized protein n=1 Tax=Choristoneura fumiferana TaxID=7141 RepID=UPI003D159E20
MSPLARSLLALAAAALLLGACAASKEAGDHCTEINSGRVSDNPVLMDTIFIPPGQCEAVIDISLESLSCSGSPPLGLLVSACADVAPTLTPDWHQHRILVTRNGFSCDTTATVSITLWCPPPL